MTRDDLTALAERVEAALARETDAEIEAIRRVNMDAMEKRRSDLSRRTAAALRARLASMGGDA